MDKCSRPRVVFFDLDDTLYNFRRANALGRRAAAAYCREHFGLEEDIVLAEADTTMKALADRLGLDNAAIHNRVLRYQLLCNKLAVPEIPHATALARLYWETVLEDMEPEPGIRELFSALYAEGITICIATNMTVMIQYEKLRRLGLDTWVTHLISSEEAGCEKPSAAFYEYCLHKTGAVPEECVFIGDDVHKDYGGAKAAGMHALRYAARPGSHPDEEAAAESITTYTGCVTEEFIRLGSITIRRSTHSTRA